MLNHFLFLLLNLFFIETTCSSISVLGVFTGYSSLITLLQLVPLLATLPTTTIATTTVIQKIE
jgi:hypothetical protein